MKEEYCEWSNARFKNKKKCLRAAFSDDKIASCLIDAITVELGWINSCQLQSEVILHRISYEIKYTILSCILGYIQVQ